MDYRERIEEESVAGEERLRELEEKYEDYKVYDNRGDRIGKVDDLFVDETDSEEYIGVKMGFLGMRSTLIPMDIVRVNEADRTIEVSDTKDHVKDAPSFDDDEDITGEYERRIRDHFGLESVEPSSSRAGYTGSSDRNEATTGEATGAATAGAHEHDDSGHHEDRESGTDAEYEEGPRDHEPQDAATAEHPTAEADHADANHAEAGAEHTDERTGTAPGGGSQSVPEYESSGEASHSGESAQTTSGEHRGSDAPEGSGTGSGSKEVSEGAATGVPTSRQTEETETFQAGGRTKVRRRIVREEVVDADEDPNTR